MPEQSLIQKHAHRFKNWLKKHQASFAKIIEEEDEEQPTPGFIGDVDQAPDFLQDDYTVHGYRIGFSGFGNICRTLFRCHNETVNVWSHMLGSLAFGVVLVLIVIGAGKAIQSAAN